MDLSEQYKRFISWQCRLRKLSMRELGGRPTPGMSAGVHSIPGRVRVLGFTPPLVETG